MTIELTDLPLIPADQIAAAFTMAAAPSENGPIRFKVPLATALGQLRGPAGQGLTFRGAWAAATTYAAYDVLTSGGSCYVVTTAFTSGQGFSVTNLALIAAKGDPGAAGTGTSTGITDTASIGDLGLATAVSDTDQLHLLQGGSTDRRVTRATLLGGTDVGAATVLSALPSAGNLLFLTAAGALALLPVGLLPSSSSGSTGSSGSSGTTAVAPGQVGSLAAGVPTSMTVPLTWTAPTTGTGPFTYAVQVSPHGAGTWSAASGTFGATGGIVTGLAAATNFDYRTIVSGSGGTSTTSLTTGVSTAAASSGSSYPALTFSTPGTWDTSAPKLSTAALVGPAVATAQINLGAGNGSFCIEAFIRGSGGAGHSDASNMVLGLSDGTNVAGATFDYARMGASKGAGNVQSSGGAVVWDGAYHYLAIDNGDGGNISVNTDGGTYQSFQQSGFIGGATCTFNLNIPAGVTVDAIKVSRISKLPTQTAATIPTAAPTRDANTVVIWQLDGNGTGS